MPFAIAVEYPFDEDVLFIKLLRVHAMGLPVRLVEADPEGVHIIRVHRIVVRQVEGVPLEAGMEESDDPDGFALVTFRCRNELNERDLVWIRFGILLIQGCVPELETHRNIVVVPPFERYDERQSDGDDRYSEHQP